MGGREEKDGATCLSLLSETTVAPWLDGLFLCRFIRAAVVMHRRVALDLGGQGPDEVVVARNITWASLKPQSRAVPATLLQQRKGSCCEIRKRVVVGRGTQNHSEQACSLALVGRSPLTASIAVLLHRPGARLVRCTCLTRTTGSGDAWRSLAGRTARSLNTG